MYALSLLVVLVDFRFCDKMHTHIPAECAPCALSPSGVFYPFFLGVFAGLRTFPVCIICGGVRRGAFLCANILLAVPGPEDGALFQVSSFPTYARRGTGGSPEPDTHL